MNDSAIILLPMDYVCLEMCACAYTSRRLDFRFQMYHLFYRTGAQAFQSLYFSSFTASFFNHAWRLITRSRAIRRSRYPREIHKIVVSRSVAKINARECSDFAFLARDFVRIFTKSCSGSTRGSRRHLQSRRSTDVASTGLLSCE